MCKKNYINCANDKLGGGWAEVITYADQDNGNNAELIFDNLPSWY